MWVHTAEVAELLNFRLVILGRVLKLRTTGAMSGGLKLQCIAIDDDDDDDDDVR